MYTLYLQSYQDYFAFRERYRDLIQAADTISDMKDSADMVRMVLTVDCSIILIHSLHENIMRNIVHWIADYGVNIANSRHVREDDEANVDHVTYLHCACVGVSHNFV